MPGTPSERSRAGADRASLPPPVDTPSVQFERRSPTSRFDALFLAAQQELSSVRPACSVRSTRIVSRRAAVKRTQRDSSSGSSSSGSSGGSAGRSRVARVTPSPLATASGACSKPQRASTRAAAQSQAALQSKRQQMQGAAPAAAVLTPHTAASLRRLIVLRALVAALLRAPSPPRASCRAQHMASKLAPLLPAREQMEEQRQLEEARRFLRRF